MAGREYRICVLCAILTAFAAAVLVLAHTPVSRADTSTKPVSFIVDIAPILKDNCLACHNNGKKSGKLDLSSYASLRVGGAHDDPVVPGKPHESVLVELINANGERMMPPAGKGGPLSAGQRAVVERWVKDGAPLDNGVNAGAPILRELRKRWTPPPPPIAYPAPMAITALAFSPDGTRLVAGGYHEMTVWHMPEGKLDSRIRTRAERTYGLTFLADGLLAVAGGRPGEEGDVCLYDWAVATAPADGRWHDGVNDRRILRHRVLECDDSVLCLAKSADAKLLAAGGCDRAARIWDLSEGAAAAKLIGLAEIHADWVTGVAFAEDGHRLITTSRDKTAKVFDLARNELTLSFPDHQAAVYGIAVRSDGATAYSVGADRALRIWKADGDGKQIKAVGGHGDEVLRVVDHPTQPIVITASADKTVRVWKHDGTAVRKLNGLSDVPFALAVSPDGKWVAAAGNGGEVCMWTVGDGRLARRFSVLPGWPPVRPIGNEARGRQH